MQKIEYKFVKVLMPHCTKCKEQLQGNGSMITPYECKCGEWEYSFKIKDYKLKK